VSAPLGVDRLGAESRRAGDLEAGPVRLDGFGGNLPAFGGVDAFGDGTEEAHEVCGPGVGSGQAEAVLVAQSPQSSARAAGVSDPSRRAAAERPSRFTVSRGVRRHRRGRNGADRRWCRGR
jgi:hypothetical protein